MPQDLPSDFHMNTPFQRPRRNDTIGGSRHLTSRIRLRWSIDCGPSACATPGKPCSTLCNILGDPILLPCSESQIPRWVHWDSAMSGWVRHGHFYHNRDIFSHRRKDMVSYHRDEIECSHRFRQPRGAAFAPDCLKPSVSASQLSWFSLSW